MFMTNDRNALWIGRGAKELIFYPFGIENRGYRVPGDREDALARWTFWRAQLPVILWFAGFVPVVALWAPSLSMSGRLQPLPAVLALVLLTAASCALTMLLGAIREDLMLWTLGAMVSGVFWYAFGRELFVE